MHSEQQKLYSKHQGMCMSQICKFEDSSVSGQKEHGLKELGALITVMKIHCSVLLW